MNAMRPNVEAPANSPPACADEVDESAVPMSPVLGILFTLSFAHLVNDTLQSLIPAIYPILKTELRLDYSHIGLITLTNQLTASLLQPVVGAFTDKRPQPFSLAVGMGSTLLGLVLLALAPNLALVLVAVAFVGIGSSVFHPEASRVAHLSSGGRFGFAQSVFQVGGNAGRLLWSPPAPGIVVFSSGSVAGGPFELRRSLRFRAICFPGRRQRRQFARAAPGRGDRRLP